MKHKNLKIDIETEILKRKELSMTRSRTLSVNNRMTPVMFWFKAKIEAGLSTESLDFTYSHRKKPNGVIS